jgi:hypothetical protein
MRGVRTIAVAAVVAVTLPALASWAQPKKLVFWTHWEQNPEFNKFYTSAPFSALWTQPVQCRRDCEGGAS